MVEWCGGNEISLNIDKIIMPFFFLFKKTMSIFNYTLKKIKLRIL